MAREHDDVRAALQHEVAGKRSGVDILGREYGVLPAVAREMPDGNRARPARRFGVVALEQRDRRRDIHPRKRRQILHRREVHREELVRWVKRRQAPGKRRRSQFVVADYAQVFAVSCRRRDLDELRVVEMVELAVDEAVVNRQREFGNQCADVIPARC